MTDHRHHHEAPPSERVKPDQVLFDCGVLPFVEGPPGANEAIVERVQPYAEQFLRAGGRFSWAEWRTLCEPTREAFARAGDRMRRRESAELAAAIDDPDVRAAMAAGVEVEVIRDGNVLASAVDEVIARARGSAQG